MNGVSSCGCPSLQVEILWDQTPYSLVYKLRTNASEKETASFFRVQSLQFLIWEAGNIAESFVTYTKKDYPLTYRKTCVSILM
jgi:hypothetical protein